MKWLFVGPHMRSGIGHVTRRYCELVKGEYCEFTNKPLEKEYDIGFTFILPVPDQLGLFKRDFIHLCKKVVVMTVCETDTVNPLFRSLLEFQPIYCPSEFSRDVFKRQFGGDWRLLRHNIPLPPERSIKPLHPYTFYTIGNVIDFRKNIKMLLEAFIRLNLPDCILVLKSTSLDNASIQWKIPNVLVIQQLLTDSELDDLHDNCDCYVNCSFSEGVGMGAVEAAVRDKPVIISDYGGLKEYVKTPYIIETPIGTVGREDFLFTEDMKWGKPLLGSLMKHMKYCYDHRITTQDHSYTRSINDEVLGFFNSCTRYYTLENKYKMDHPSASPDQPQSLESS